MKINGSHTFDAPRDTLWPMLLDPNVLTKVMPGAEELEEVGDNEYEGVLKIRVGPVQGKFNGNITLTDIDAPQGYNMDVKGRGAPGFVNGSGSLRLEAQDDNTTVLHYDGDVQVGGRIASVGQRLLDTSARAVIRQSLEGLEKQVEARMHPEEAEAEGAGPQAPTQTEFALGVAKNFVEEMVPPEQRPELITKGLLILGGLILIRLLSEWWINRLARKVARIIQEERR